ncbi:MAG: hypothetical protein JNL62_16520 [Bryobacterales bacterium]|nr:hypothetical protein [Bryobacterales bacterium]
MAFRVRPFYNLDKPVGRGKSNIRHDAGLAQFFLNTSGRIRNCCWGVSKLRRRN